MGILLMLLSAQEGEPSEEILRLLQEFQTVLEMESETAETAADGAARAAAASVAAARLDRPESRRALWQALMDPNLTPETRLLVVQALQRLGELNGFMETVAALAQFGAGDGSDDLAAGRGTRNDPRTTAFQSIPAGRARDPVPQAPPPAADDKTARRNTVLGIASLCVVALLLLLRKGRSP